MIVLKIRESFQAGNHRISGVDDQMQEVKDWSTIEIRRMRAACMAIVWRLKQPAYDVNAMCIIVAILSNVSLTSDLSMTVVRISLSVMQLKKCRMTVCSLEHDRRTKEIKFSLL